MASPILSIHRTRDLAVRQRTQLANMIRSLLREFGHILPIGIEAVTAFAKRHLDGDHPDMPEIATGMLGIQCYQFIGLNERIEGYSKMIEQHARLPLTLRSSSCFAISPPHYSYAVFVGQQIYQPLLIGQNGLPTAFRSVAAFFFDRPLACDDGAREPPFID